ncbi:MAG TPA: hypothetical protein VIH57_21645 [Bacteroidales bacterium]
MKPNPFIKIAVFILIGVVWTSCQDKVIEKYSASVPVYMSYTDLRQAVKSTESATLEKPGKIYFKDHYIYINEYFKGVHVIDNTNPASPKEKKFIEIPGNVDIAIKDNTLYADSYVDLVAIDISNLANVREVHRIKDVFSYAIPENPVNYYDEWPDATKGVVLRWEVKEVTKDVKPQTNPVYYDIYTYRGDLLSNFTGAKTSSTSGSQGGTSSVGVAGSMARFAIKQDALYVLSTFEIKVVNITDIDFPVTTNSITNYSGIETIFLNDEFMYLGAQTGMSIYEVSNPFKPKFVSTYNHFTSCDPVVVEDNYAYVTLRAGIRCRNTATNQLDVIDISDKLHPTLLTSYGFSEPHGLGIENSILFLCDGEDGLKVFNATDVMHIKDHLISHFKNIQATDVIPVGGNLFMIGDNGFYQYDYTDLQNIKLLSKIEVKH